MFGEVAYEDYQSYGGALGEEAFKAILPRVRAQLDYLIGPNEVTDEAAYVEAACLAVDAWDKAENAGDSIKIGNFSASGLSGSDGKQAVTDVALQVLGPTGMLWAGLR